MPPGVFWPGCPPEVPTSPQLRTVPRDKQAPGCFIAHLGPCKGQKELHRDRDSSVGQRPWLGSDQQLHPWVQPSAAHFTPPRLPKAPRDPGPPTHSLHPHQMLLHNNCSFPQHTPISTCYVPRHIVSSLHCDRGCSSGDMLYSPLLKVVLGRTVQPRCGGAAHTHLGPSPLLGTPPGPIATRSNTNCSLSSEHHRDSLKSPRFSKGAPQCYHSSPAEVNLRKAKSPVPGHLSQVTQLQRPSTASVPKSGNFCDPNTPHLIHWLHVTV